MSDLEKAKKRVQLIKAQAAKEELKFKILEREEDIKRIKDHIGKQEELIEELESELKE